MAFTNNTFSSRPTISAFSRQEPHALSTYPILKKEEDTDTLLLLRRRAQRSPNFLRVVRSQAQSQR